MALKLELNNANNIKELLQESYKHANDQIVLAQNEISKMANATRLQDATFDEKQKYGKVIADYMAIKDKAIKQKIDIAKLMTEIYQHNGNVKDALENTSSKGSTLDFKKIREMVDKNYEENPSKTIEITKN